MQPGGRHGVGSIGEGTACGKAGAEAWDSASASHPHPHCPQLTQAVEAERPVVQEEADVARTGRHGAKGVRAARGEGVEANGQEEDQQRKAVGLCAEAGAAQHQEAPQEVPGPGTYSGAWTQCLASSWPPPGNPI